MNCGICGKSKGEGKILNGTRYGYDFLCRKHHEQFVRRGRYLDKENDSQRNPSEINIIENTIEITLKNSRYEVVGKTYVDLENYHIVKNKRWSLNANGYAVSKINEKTELLHHLIMNKKDALSDMVIDHKDRNKLNNKLENLRVIEKQDNHKNHNGYKSNKSGFTGVSMDKSRGKWKAIININKKQKLLGRFDNLNEAVIERLNAELKYYGEEFSPQRHLFDDYGIGVNKHNG